MLSKLREPVNGLTHLFAAVFAGLGLIALVIIGWGQVGKTISLTIYGLSLVLLFSASATYHMVKAGPKALNYLRKLDHTAIFLLIAGTYTPICVVMFHGFWQWGILAIIWSLALAGIILKMFFINTPRWLSAGVYVMMGWLAIAGIGELLHALPTGALAWLAAGGIIYTLGALVYATRTLDFFPGKFGFHEVWHIFVILGALAHFIMVAFYVAPKV